MFNPFTRLRWVASRAPHANDARLYAEAAFEGVNLIADGGRAATLPPLIAGGVAINGFTFELPDYSLVTVEVRVTHPADRPLRELHPLLDPTGTTWR